MKAKHNKIQMKILFCVPEMTLLLLLLLLLPLLLEKPAKLKLINVSVLLRYD